MPLYNYRCKHDACAHEWEEISLASERVKHKVCPKCRRLSGIISITISIAHTPTKWGDTPRGNDSFGHLAGNK